MSKLLVFTDRAPHDPDWKGAYTWRLILDLAESQHEVLVVTTLEPTSIPVTHPRLNLAQPAPDWRADRMPRFAQAVLQFRPQVIHTFALNPSRLWPALTVWPYLNTLTQAFAGVKRVSTFFSGGDLNPKAPEWSWHQGANRWTVFSPLVAAQARAHFQGAIDTAPLELELPALYADAPDEQLLLVPAPVSDWDNPIGELMSIADHLNAHPERRLDIAGGWGDLPLSERRRGWEALTGVAHQVHMLEPESFPEFLARVRTVKGLWMRGLSPLSWRAQLAQAMAERLGKPVHGPRLDLISGSTANFLSRLYST